MSYRDIMKVEATKMLYTAYCLKKRQTVKVQPFLEDMRKLAESEEPIKSHPIREMLATNKANIH